MRNSPSLRLFTVAGLLVLAAAFAARVAPAVDVVFPGAGKSTDSGVQEGRDADGEVRLLGNDPWYHLRHARLDAARFPHIERLDRWVNYPRGYRAPEPGLYALGMAAVATAIGGRPPSEHILERVVAWTPPILGAAAYGVLMLLAGVLWGPGPGVLAGVILLAYPGTFLDRSLLGFSDHHVAEVLLSLLGMLGVAVLLRRSAFDDSTGKVDPFLGAGWGFAFLCALPLAVFQFTWDGAPIHLLFTACALGLAGALSLARDDVSGPARSTFRFGVAFTLMVAVPGALWPVLVQEPSVRPQVLLAGALIALALPGALLATDRLVRRFGWPRRRVVLGATAVAAAAVAAWFGLSSEGRWVWDLLAERRAPLVSELTARIDLHSFLRVATPTTALAVAAPFVMLWTALTAGRSRRPSGAELAVLTLAVCSVLLWAGTGDFGYKVAPCSALLATYVLVRAWGGLRPRLGLWTRTTVAGAALAGFFVAPAVGLAGSGRPWATADQLSSLMFYNDGWDEALHWMARKTPSDGSYGVMVTWDFGNFVTAVGRRPVLWSQGPDPRSDAFLMARSEARGEQILDSLPGNFRYVVADARSVGDFFAARAIRTGTPESALRKRIGDASFQGKTVPLYTYGAVFDESMAHRLYYANGSEMGRYRLVYRSPQRSLTAYALRVTDDGTTVGRIAQPIDRPGDLARALRLQAKPTQVVDVSGTGLLYFSRVEPTVKVFERVKGAVLVGRAAPGARVRATTVLFSDTDRRRMAYQRTTTTGSDGRFRLRVPYPTGIPGAGTEVRTLAPYRIVTLPAKDSVDPSARPPKPLAEGVTVTEEDVRSGLDVAVPLGRSIPGGGVVDRSTPRRVPR